tara:strand:- start:238 stop:765 length:528 start_codon:yes stop_codon:yes gene_type:complete
MAHFAKLGVNGKVLSVEVVADADCQGADGTEMESIGIDFLNKTHGWPLWAKTSYNTRGGKYYNADGTEASDQSKAYRGNYAGIGYTWDEDNEIFWPKQPHASWTKNNSTASWVAPITYPSVTDDGQDPVVFTYMISWNEAGYQADNTKGWEATKSNDSADPKTIHDWNGSAWVAR